MDYSPQQADAIDSVLAWYAACKDDRGSDPAVREFYLAGYAGTGKTTIAKEIVRRLRNDFGCVRIVSGAYTGKAVDVMRNKGVYNPMTVHKMIYMPVQDPITKKTKFVVGPAAPASTAQIIILDECSMVDRKMAEDLRSFRKPILIMGDPAQLPPISGTGFVIGREPDCFLTEIHRQAADNPILKLATMARNGDYIPVGEYGDKVLVTDDYSEEVMKKWVFTKKRQPICGANKTRNTINRLFRKYMGIENSVLPIKGEKLICCQNEIESGLFNGMMGRAAFNTKPLDPHHCTVFFQNASESDPFLVESKSTSMLFKRAYEEHVREPEYRKGIQKFDFGYCLTVHKSQGSEWDHVTVIDESSMFREHSAKHLYTAITRAAKSLVIIQKR